MNARRRRLHSSPARVRGVTLIELMVAVVLGLIVSGAALALFVTNKQTFSASESLGRIQEGERTAFELMARDVREGAGNACEKGISVANVLNTPTANWYTDFSGGIRGYDGGTAFTDAASAFGTGVGQRVSGTDAIELKSSVSSGVNVVVQPGHTSADIKVNTIASDFKAGDIAMACNFDHGAIFQISQVNGGGVNLVHNTANSTIPGNCTNGLAFPAKCSPPATDYDFGDNQPSILAKLRATRWYIGYNGHTYNGQASKSLYQSTVENIAGVLTPVNNEITEGVSDMQMKYLVEDATSYVDAAAGTPWDKVLAVNLDLTLQGGDRVSTSNGVLQRHLQHVVTLRNRAP